MRNRVFLRALVVREAAALALLVVIVLLVAATSDGNGPWLAALALFGVFLVVGAARITFTDRRVALRTGRATPPWEGAHATWGVVVAPITGPRATAVARRAIGRTGGREVEAFGEDLVVGWVGSVFSNLQSLQSYELAVTLRPGADGGTEFICSVRPRFSSSPTGSRTGGQLLTALRGHVGELAHVDPIGPRPPTAAGDPGVRPAGPAAGTVGSTPTGGVSWWDSTGVTVVNAVVCVVGTAVSLAALVGLLVTFLPGTSALGPDAFVVPFVLAFPLWGWMFLVLARRPHPALGGGSTGPRASDRRWTGVGSLIDAVPVPARVVLPVVFLGAWLIGLTAIGGLRGQPEIDPTTGRYVENDHGRLLPVSRADYLHAVAVQNRLFLSVALVFTSIATAVAWGEWSRRRRAGRTGPRAGARPAWSRPRWALPILPSLLVAGAGLVVAVVCVATIAVRVTAYTGDAPRVPPRGAVEVTLTPGEYVVFVGCTEELVCPDVPLHDLEVRAPDGSPVPLATPSGDEHMSYGSQPYVGIATFDVGEPGRFRLSASTAGSPHLVVNHPTGQEAVALAGWIAGGLAGLAVFGYAAAGWIAGYRRRTGTGEAGDPQLGPGSAATPSGV